MLTPANENENEKEKQDQTNDGNDRNDDVEKSSN